MQIAKLEVNLANLTGTVAVEQFAYNTLHPGTKIAGLYRLFYYAY